MLYKVLNSKWIEQKSWWINIPRVVDYVWTAFISVTCGSNHISAEKQIIKFLIKMPCLMWLVIG